MEALGAVLPRSLAASRVGRRRSTVPERRAGFSDDGQSLFYMRCGGERRMKEEKKRSKLVKDLAKDLSAFYSMGPAVVEAGAEGMEDGGAKGKMIAEATELLLSQLKLLKDQEKELKRNKKQEKAAMKSARVKDCGKEDSSSSSSESSDSDCEMAVKMTARRTGGIIETKPCAVAATAPPLHELRSGENSAENHIALIPAPECGGTNSSNGSVGGCKSSSAVLVAKTTEKVEVCMGGKCKKSGAMELLEEFERKIGIEGVVVSCKCMGKCRDGPNVRISNHSTEERNPLCIGVGLEDVSSLVASFLGEKKDVGFLAA